MGKRLGALALLITLLAVGALLGSAFSQWRREPVPRPASVTLPPIEGRVRVEVLNRGGRSGVAREATGVLRDLGFDVVYYGNAGTFTEDSSVVLDRVGHLVAAGWTARALGIPAVRSEPDTTRYLDVTVFLGPEWDLPEAEGPEEQPSAPWWDLRRFFRRTDSTEAGDLEDR